MRPLLPLLPLALVLTAAPADARSLGARAPDRLVEPSDEPWRAHGEPLERSDTATQLVAPTGRLALHATVSLHLKPSGPDVAALAMLDVPLGALLAKKPSAAKARAEPSVAAAPPAAPLGIRRSSAAPTAEPQRVEKADRVDGASAAPAPPELPAALVSEPSPYPVFVITPEEARALVGAAHAQAGLEQAERRLTSLAGRARASALLPELRLRAARVTDEEERLAPTDYDPSRRLASVSSSLWLEARATFRLDRLVFSEEEVGLEKQKRELRAERARLSAEVLAHVAALARAHAAQRDPSLAEHERALAWLSVLEHESALDELTGGASKGALRGASPSTSPGLREPPARAKSAPEARAKSEPPAPPPPRAPLAR